MKAQTVRICVPTLPQYARTVRMMAANLAVLCEMSVDDVEDVRMAAEEGFVYACSTTQEACDISFSLSQEGIEASFSLGEASPGSGDEDARDASGTGAGTDLDLAWLLLSAVSDECSISDDATVLRLFKAAGVGDVG